MFPTWEEAKDYVTSSWPQPHRRKCYMNFASTARSPKPSATSFAGGRALRATLRVLQDGENQAYEYLCCLDSGSDVNLANRHLLHDVHSMDMEEIPNCGSETQFCEEGTLRIFLSGAVVSIYPGPRCHEGPLPFSCDVLLGVPEADDLGVKFLDAHRNKLRRLECHVGEKTLRTLLEGNGTQEVANLFFDVAEVVLNPELPPAIQKCVGALLAEFVDMFAGEKTLCPNPLQQTRSN
jgi:hypothetical protein